MVDTTAQATWTELFDPFDQKLIAAPYPQYRWLRSQDPVHWSPPLRAWVLTRMEDIQTILNDKSFVAIELSKTLAEIGRRAGRNYDPLVQVLDAILFFKDGTRHRHDRRAISKIMNLIPLSKLEAAIDDFASSLSSPLRNLAGYDVIEKFASPLPQYVMAHILGLPFSDIPLLSELLTRLTLVFDMTTLDVYDSVNEKAREALDLLESRVVEAAESGAENGLSILYRSMSGPENERRANAAATALFVYRVGAETTIGLIGFLVLALIDNPKLYQMIREDPSVSQAVVSEVLRLESNVQRSVRLCQEDCVIGGKTIRAGERLLLLLGAANRDPAAFAAPDDLKVDRGDPPDVVFGAGHHFCLGASLARLEGRISLDHFVRLPPIELAGEESWYPGRSIRRLTRLPVEVVRV